MSFEQLKQEVQSGMDGRNNGIPMGFDRLNKHIVIRKSIYTLVGGNTGSGKTSFIDDAYVLNPCDWYIDSKRNKTDINYRTVTPHKTTDIKNLHEYLVTVRAKDCGFEYVRIHISFGTEHWVLFCSENCQIR